MRTFPRLALVVAVLIGFAAGIANATTLDSILKLKANNVSDEVLIALIESDGSIFYLSAEDVLVLKKQGVSDKLILAMLNTTKKAPPAGWMGQVVDQPLAPVPVEPPPPPVVVNVTQTVEQKVESPRQMQPYDYYSPYYGGYGAVAVPVAVPVVRQQPVFWGWGGQQRPDSWRLPGIPLPSHPGGPLVRR